MRRYNEEDYPTLGRWASQYGIELCSPRRLPKVGYIIDDKACGFLYQTDSDICYLDLIIANKEQPHDDELDMIVDALCDYAKSEGYNMVIALTRHKVVIDRAVRHRFETSTDHTIVYKQL